MNFYKNKLLKYSRLLLDFWSNHNPEPSSISDKTLNTDDVPFRQAIELEDPRKGLFDRRALVVVAGAVFLSIPIAALTPIIKVIDASGDIIPRDDIFVINNIEGGLVSNVLVKNGTEVKKGDTLITLNPSLIQSDIDQRLAKSKSLGLQQQQLKQALKLDTDNITLNQNETTNPNLNEVQKDLLEVRIRNHKDQIKVASAVIQEKVVELESLNNQLELAIETENMWRSLSSDGAASKLKLLTSESQTEQIRGKRNEIEKALEQAKLNLINLKSDYELINTSTLANLASEEYVTNSGSMGKDFELENMTIKAPISGIISDLRFTNKGSVVVPGAQVVSIVPTNTIREAKIRIPAKDIGFIKAGQKVNINLLPFKESVYGSLSGTVKTISGSTLKNEKTGEYYYESIASVDQQYIEISKSKVPLQVGMPLIAEIKTSKRSLLSYLLEPFTRVSEGIFEE